MNSPATQRSALTPGQSHLLFAIWKLETDPDRQRNPVTCRELADMLHGRVERIQRLIHEIEAILPGCFTSHHMYGEQSKPGRPLTSYHLNQEGVVTFPETAVILIELLKFRADGPYRVNRAAFEQHLAARGMDPVLIKDRIAINIKVGYIREVEGFPGSIFPTDKVEFQRPYIERLAGEYKAAKSQTST